MQLELDLQFFAGEKTEKATPKKREDERQKGRVAKSQDVNTALLLLFSFIILAVLGSFMKENMLTLYISSFTDYIHWNITEQSIMKLLKEIVVQFAMIVAPIMIVAFIIS